VTERAGGNGRAGRRIPVGVVEQLLGGLAPPPRRAWIALLVVAAFMSMFEVTRAADSGLTVIFRLTPVTAALVALLWLPTLIRVWALGGGTVKTPAGEATFAGIPLDLLRELDVETRREALTGLIAVADAVETQGARADAPALREVRTALEEDLAALAPNAKAAREQLTEFAGRYDALRNTAAGTQRTWEMTKLIGAARALAPQANFKPHELAEMLNSNSQGHRIVMLAAIQAAPDRQMFELALEAIDKSRSAFEQWHALVAVEAMLDGLTPDERDKLREVLNRQRSGAPDTWINTSDRSRWDLSARILARLRPRAREGAPKGA
jgi:hypothetical protein